MMRLCCVWSAFYAFLNFICLNVVVVVVAGWLVVGIELTNVPVCLQKITNVGVAVLFIFSEYEWNVEKHEKKNNITEWCTLEFHNLKQAMPQIIQNCAVFFFFRVQTE